ncbi:translation initiation factor eIF-2B subunit alpha [Galendromus occidentalis]|uniref:Translation initiation factor eIF2B subunit alpha n=1 Tax=Galendromus occidentalis TaxID=34638 RepID=A0AAJ6QRT0_9ACAR|nr:translation initiation factor eIF-2B subunit alpha [Galendromus occidentalis]
MVVDYAQQLERKCQEEPDLAPIVPAIRILLSCLRDSDFGSIQELQTSLNNVSESLMTSSCATIGVESACELFKRYITLTRLDVDLNQLKPALVSRGESFLRKISSDRHKVAKLAAHFILNGHRILVHSRSRVVRDALLEAAKRSNFTVYITESAPDQSGAQMAKELSTVAGIECHVLKDAAVGYFMERIDLVLLGAEGIVESGGIINRIGTFQIAVCARQLNKPVYVLAESVKCIRFFPLSQRDLKSLPNAEKDGHPCVDYTSPDFIRLLITDLGTLTPSAVSDELIKLYL